MELDHGGHGGTRRITGRIDWAVTAPVTGSAVKVHSALGPGLLESVYEECMCRELSKRGIPFERQVSVPIRYDGINLAAGLRLDLLVADRIIVEIKAVDKLLPIHDAQLLTYLRLSGKRFGLLINFNVPHMRDGGIRRKLL
jgi:GxxExxY protein